MRRHGLILVILLLAFYPPPSARGQISPAGDVFTVNDDPSGDQSWPRVAVKPDGEFVVVWATAGDPPEGVDGRLLRPEPGDPGTHFVVKQPGGDLRSPEVAVYDGGFFVSWMERRIFTRRFDAAATPFEDLVPLDTLSNFRDNPALAAFPDGHLALAFAHWAGVFSEYDIWATEFEAEGDWAVYFEVNQDHDGLEYTPFQTAPAAASDPAGRYVVVWQHDTVAIDARRFERGSQPLGDQFRVAGRASEMLFPTGTFLRPRVAADAQGNFLVVWEGGDLTGDLDIWARRYDAEGVPRGEAFEVNAADSTDQRWPDVTMDRKGNAVVVWRQTEAPGDEVLIRGRALNALGELQGPHFEIASVPAAGCGPLDEGHCSPRAALAEDDALLVVWDDPGVDGDGRGIAGRRFTTDLDTDCRPGSHTACLNRGRFEVEVSWRDYSDQVGSGRLAPGGSGDSGIFWFFTPDNWELLVKVLDGCAINDRYWVYAAATTDVEYTLTVTDTLHLVSVDYTNLLGTASPAVTDSAAFATCP